MELSTTRPCASIQLLVGTPFASWSMRNARTVSKCSGTQVIVVESRSALSETTSVDSAAMRALTSRPVRSRGSNSCAVYERPERSSPPKASRNGNNVGSVIGPCRGIRVICESPSETMATDNTVSPMTRPCAANCPRSPSNVVSTVSRRRARDNIVMLRAVVRCSVPNAATSSTNTFSTRIASGRVSMVVEE